MDLVFCAALFLLDPWRTILCSLLLVSEEAPVYRFALVFPAILLLAFSTSGQQQKPDSSAAQKTPSYSTIPVEAAKTPNPVKPTPESLTRARKWWTLDCEMCHNKNGDGKGETARDMKLTMVDFTDPATLKDRTDGEIYWIIKNGHNDMPVEGPRITTEQGWDLVNYVRSFAKKKEGDAKQESEAKPQ
jgi:Cytochrome C oxidase, cbb3-type, subunit III